MDNVDKYREMVKHVWLSLPSDKNKTDSYQIRVDLLAGRVKKIQDIRKYYASQTSFYGKFALFYALKYKLYNRNYKLIVRL